MQDPQLPRPKVKTSHLVNLGGNMKTKHTSGPWGIMHDGPIGDGKPWVAFKGTVFEEVAPSLTIASPHNTEPICRVSGYLHPVMANAHLIAAAPELLTMLRRFYDATYGETTTGKLCALDFEQAIAAIAKAEGKD